MKSGLWLFTGPAAWPLLVFAAIVSCSGGKPLSLSFRGEGLEKEKAFLEGKAAVRRRRTAWETA
jgi:hypothetical protein